MGYPATSANSSRRRLDERGSQIDCLHDEVLVSSTTKKESGNSRVGKVALRACSSMPTRQYNRRRSTLLHRLAREYGGVLGTTRLQSGAISTGRPRGSQWLRSTRGSCARKADPHDSLSSPPHPLIRCGRWACPLPVQYAGHASHRTSQQRAERIPAAEGRAREKLTGYLRDSRRASRGRNAT